MIGLSNNVKVKQNMNAIVKANTQSMSSIEIAELCGKRHSDVIRDIRNILVKLDNAILRHEQYQELIDERGYTKEFLLNKNLTITLVTGYDVNTRHRINIRWQELEAQVAQPVDPMILLSDPNVLRTTLLTYTEKVIALENKVVEMQPAVEAFDRLSKAEGSLCLTDAAKALQQSPQKFIKYLHAVSWIYKRNGSKHWVGYQEKVQSGYLEHKVSEILFPDGSIRISEQVRITPKGLTKLSKNLGNLYV